MTLWLVPLHLFPLTKRPQFALVSSLSKPGPPQFVQDVTGLGRFMVGPTELSACPGGQHPFSFFQASL